MNKHRSAATKVGLVLSGGGGAGILIESAMLLELLCSRVINFTHLYGCSAGSLVAAAYALDPSLEAVSNLVDRGLSLKQSEVFGHFARLRRTIQQYRFFISSNSVQGFLSQKNYLEFLREFFNHATFSDIDPSIQKLAIIGHDIAAKSPVIVTGPLEGRIVWWGKRLLSMRAADLNLAEAVYISSAQPPEVPPYNWGSAVLVDGGLTKVLPVELALADGVDELWVFSVTSANRPTPDIKGLGSIVQESVDSMVADNLQRSLKALEDANGIPVNLVLGDNFPELGDFLSFFDHKQELVDYGTQVMKNYLKNPQPMKLRRL
jgi:predicted acylesterase/phospholipase RssA